LPWRDGGDEEDQTMSMDAGTYTWTFPANGQATDAANAAALTPTGDKVTFVAQEGVDVVEVGVVIGTATAATSLVFTVASSDNLGGTYTVQNTVTGPASAIASGGVLRSKSCKIHLNKGDGLKFSVTTAVASGTGQFYAKCYPAGSQTLDTVSTT
jgi:hypothetical protein